LKLLLNTIKDDQQKAIDLKKGRQKVHHKKHQQGNAA
jgi:hypothetical protein